MQQGNKLKEDPPAEPPSTIKNVWKYNCEKEFLKINELINQGFTFVAMDTEFPGFIFDYNGAEINSEIIYSVVKANVDMMNAIQVGITLADGQGRKPEGTDTWQFNLSFSTSTQKLSPDSINLLKEAGIKFDEMSEHGINHKVFGDYLMTSGLVVNADITWITFHGCYDFAYLMKMLMDEPLPPTSNEFSKYLEHLFPVIFDVKVLITEFQEWKNDSLSRLAMKLDLKRAGITHQAGSDALLTTNVFFKIKSLKYTKGFPDSVCNKVFGLSSGTSMQVSEYQSEMYSGQLYPYHAPYTYPYDPHQFHHYNVFPEMANGYFFQPQTIMASALPPKYSVPYPPPNQTKDSKKK